MDVFRITSSTTFIFIYNRILWTNFKKLSSCLVGGGDISGWDRESVWVPPWTRVQSCSKINMFRITSSTTFIFIYNRILWTNFKKLTVVVQKKWKPSASQALQLLFLILMWIKCQDSDPHDTDSKSSMISSTNFKKLTEVDQKMRVFRITSSTAFIFNLTLKNPSCITAPTWI